MTRRTDTKAFVTVSSKGKINGLSDIENDGADFGPDTAGTKSSGIIEAINSSQSGNVILLDGEFRTESQITVREGISIFGSQKSIIVNDIEDPYQPVLIFKPYTNCSFLIVNANGKSGIQIGDEGNNSIKMDYVKVYNTGNSYISNDESNIAVTIRGFNVIINALDIYKGNIGIKIDGGSDIRITDLQVVEAVSGLIIVSSEHVTFGHLSVDSCSHIGVQIDSSKDISLRGIIWNNATACPVNELSYGILLGSYSSGYRNTLIDIDANIIGTGGTAIKIENTDLCKLNLKIGNDVLNTLGKKIVVGLEYGGGLGLIDTNLLTENVDLPVNGKIVGRLVINGKSIS
ncbi:MAG: hypothetical protein QW078_02190 [Thermoplasmatales archaeon]